MGEPEPIEEGEERQAESEPAPAAEGAAPAEGTPATPGAPSRRRDPKFRAELLERLPKLGYARWSAKEDFKIDEEWGTLASLQSDAVLGPLEPIAPERRS